MLLCDRYDGRYVTTMVILALLIVENFQICSTSLLWTSLDSLLGRKRYTKQTAKSGYYSKRHSNYSQQLAIVFCTIAHTHTHIVHVNETIKSGLLSTGDSNSFNNWQPVYCCAVHEIIIIFQPR